MSGELEGGEAKKGGLATPVIWAIFLAVATGGVGTAVWAYLSTEQTRECTVEARSFHQSYGRRAGGGHQELQTRECGVVQAYGRDIEVVERGCAYPLVTAGSRYRITTRGFEWTLSALPAQIIGPIVLVHAPPGTPCASDSWLTPDPPSPLGTPDG